jgi:hypothetical protein
VNRLRIARTFVARVTCALALAVAGLNIAVTSTPPLLDGGAWGGLAATAAVVFGTGYLAVCGTELLLGAVRPPLDL